MDRRHQTLPLLRGVDKIAFSTVQSLDPSHYRFSLWYPWRQPYASHKLDPRSTPCDFLGYSTTQSAYFCLDRTTSRIYTSRHVVFHEYVYPFALPNPLMSASSVDDSADGTTSSTPAVTIIPLQRAPAPTIDTPPVVPPQTNPTNQTTTASQAAETVTTTPTIIETTQQQSAIPSSSSPTVVATTEDTAAPTSTAQPPAPTRQSTRQRKPVNKLNLCTTVTLYLDTIPTSVAEALKDPRW